jgi:hypothetical protein
MAHHRPDDAPPGAAAPLAAAALPGGPNGASGPVLPPCPAGLGLTALRTTPGLVLTWGAVASAPEPRGARMLIRTPGSSKGSRPAAAPASKLAAIVDVGEGGVDVPSIDSAAGAGDESSALPVSDVTPLLPSVTL